MSLIPSVELTSLPQVITCRLVCRTPAVLACVKHAENCNVLNLVSSGSRFLHVCNFMHLGKLAASPVDLEVLCACVG